MSYGERREKVLEAMEEDSVLFLYSGISAHISSDTYYPFQANTNFFYLTGLRRENMILVLRKVPGQEKETLYIEKVNPSMERWTGKMVTIEEAKTLTGIEDVRTIDSFEGQTSRMLSEYRVNTAYFDTYREQAGDLPDYNAVKALEFQKEYPGIQLKNCWPVLTELRMRKDADEETLLRKAIGITDLGLKQVMTTLKPGMKEYEAQAEFEYRIFKEGAECVSFPTIAGSGKNGTMLHYETNRDTCAAGTLLLLDLGARYEGYNADITRTYPVNGHFTDRQRQVYDVVLRANREIARVAKAGMTLRELNDICKKVLAEGCKSLGLIKEDSELSKYYMHSVSHHLGIDVHDVCLRNEPLRAGAVISDEPGLYIDEWEIGIRIEDDLMLTEDGCKVLSEAVMRDPEEIEAFMKQ